MVNSDIYYLQEEIDNMQKYWRSADPGISNCLVCGQTEKEHPLVNSGLVGSVSVLVCKFNFD